MEQKPLCPPYSASLATQVIAVIELAPADLIFVQDLGLVPKRLIAPSQPGTLPAAERKWLGTDFSHVIVSKSSSR